MKQKILNFNQFFESINNDDEIGDLEVINYELPEEVKKTTLKILRGINDSFIQTMENISLNFN
jgi:hypothetical protein